MTRVGSLFTGYGGLDMAVGGDLAWYSEIEPAACKVLGSHYPEVNNLGDIKQIDWSSVDPVDVLTGGYPCQPFSNAGKRLGEEDERHLWPYVKQAIGTLRPPLVILENVRGHLTLGFKTVLGEIAQLGYDARWGIVRASDAGAPHQRARLFIAAYPKSTTWGDKKSEHLAKGEWPTKFRERASSTPHPDSNSIRREYQSGNLDREDNTIAATRESSKNIRTTASNANQNDKNSDDKFGAFANAITRWQLITNRIAPDPIVKIKERDKINPVFVEWMMGLPEGHVTGHGLTLSQELKMLGNGVVPQQASLALRLLGVTK